MSEYELLKAHVGHRIVCVTYGDQNVSIECEDCFEVLHDVDLSTSDDKTGDFQ